MSRKLKIKHMTPEELKSKLYAHFQKTGSLDHLKAHLRGQLVSELFKVADNIDPNSFPNAADVEKCLLPLQVCNWLIYDHLSRQDYQYSLSTFVTEAHLPNPEKLLTAGDILGLLGLNSNAGEFHNVSKLYTENNELGCLNSLLLSIMKALFNIPNKDSILNQSYNQNSEMNDSAKQKAENNYEELSDKFFYKEGPSCDTSFQNKILKSKNMSLDKSFLSNNDIQSAEASFQEQLQSVKKEKEREIQKLRHKLLEELENLHSQEHKMQIEMELEKTELRREQNKLAKEREILEEKKVLLEKETANKFEQKMKHANEDFASKLHFKDKEIETLKAKLMEKEQKLAQVEAALSNQKDNVNLIKRELDDLRHMYKIIQDKYSSVLDENTNLLKKFEGMSDYSILKDELSSKTKEILKLQNEIKDMHLKSEIERKKYVETVRNLEDDLNAKEPQLIQAQRELDLVRNTLSSEEAMWNKEKRKLEWELNEFKELYKGVVQRMNEQEDNMQDLQRTIHILNYKVNNNAVSIAKPESFKSYKNFQRTSENSLKSKPETLFIKRNSVPQHSPERYKDTSLKFISDAKNRFGKLKQEEDAVQEKYSFIFSSLPEKKETESATFENFSSIHKNNFENYELPSLKDIPFNSGFNFANKMTNLKSPYTLTNVKKMVSRSLFPAVNMNKATFHRDIDYLDIYSTESSMRTKTFKDTSKESNGYSETYAKQSTFSKSKGDSNMSSINKNISSNGEQPHDLQNIIYSKDQIKETVSNSVQNELEQESNLQEKQSLIVSSKIFPDDSNKCVSSDVLEFSLSKSDEVIKTSGVNTTNNTNSVSHRATLNSATAIPAEEVLPTMPDKSNSTSNSKLSGKYLVNLDAVWKKQSTALPSFQQNINETTSKGKGENAELQGKDTVELHDKRDTYELQKDDSAVELKAKGTSFLIQSSTTAFDKVLSSVQDTSDNKLKTVETNAGNDNTPKESLDFRTTNNSMTVNETSEQKAFEEQSQDRNSIAKEPGSDPKDDGNSNIDKSSNIDDASTKENFAKSAEKIPSADSLSELSEIHLSCGSEPEQEKEDSDAW